MIAVKPVAAFRRYLSEPLLQALIDYERYPPDSVQSQKHVLVVYAINFIKNHDKGILDSAPEELVDTVNGSVAEELLANVNRLFWSVS